MLWCSHACLQTCCCSSTMDGCYPVFPDSELSYKEVSLLGFLSLVWWSPSEWDVAHICCRTEMDGWRTMTAQVNPAEESSGIMQTWVHCWKKRHTHTCSFSCDLVPLCFMWPVVVCWGMLNRTTNGPDTQPDNIKLNWLVPALSLYFSSSSVDYFSLLPFKLLF